MNGTVFLIAVCFLVILDGLMFVISRLKENRHK